MTTISLLAAAKVPRAPTIASAHHAASDFGSASGEPNSFAEVEVGFAERPSTGDREPYARVAAAYLRIPSRGR